MSYALRAAVLIAVDRDEGSWVPIGSIARRVGLLAGAVLVVAESLVREGQIERREVDGEAQFGLHVKHDSPVIGSTAP